MQDLGGVHSALAGSLDLTYPADGCSKYVYNDTNPAPLPCSANANNGPKFINPIPCACLLGLEKGIISLFLNLLKGVLTILISFTMKDMSLVRTSFSPLLSSFLAHSMITAVYALGTVNLAANVLLQTLVLQQNAM